MSSPDAQAAAALPRVLINTADPEAGAGAPDASGAVWKLDAAERDLDSNIIALPAGREIDAHTGPDLDVLIQVLSGSGRLSRDREALDLAPGALVWLPRRSRRRIAAGSDGLRYLTVHRRRPAL